MKKYNVIAQDANNDQVQLFIQADEKTFLNFINEYCENHKDLQNESYRWLKGYELPEYNLPYRCQGWLIKFYAE